MEYQYTTIDTDFGTYRLVRVFDNEDGKIAVGEHFREHLAETIGDEDLVVLYRNPETGSHEWYSSFPLPMSDEKLDAELWLEGEWFP